jgi:hypothetical protein
MGVRPLDISLKVGHLLEARQLLEVGHLLEFVGGETLVGAIVEGRRILLIRRPSRRRGGEPPGITLVILGACENWGRLPASRSPGIIIGC